MHKPLKQLERQSLAAAALDGPEVEQFKSDGRSRVWSVERGGALIVVKRFEYRPLRQRLALPFGRHPAQLELRGNKLLRDAGIRVVPIIDGGIEPAGLGRHIWLATPHGGVSLQRALADPGFDVGLQEQLIDAAALLAIDLVGKGLIFKDFKPSNLIVDHDLQLHVIDAGSVRKKIHADHVSRMLGVMTRVMARDHTDNALRVRFMEKTGEKLNH